MVVVCVISGHFPYLLFDFGDGTDDFSKSSSELESESSVSDFLFLFDERV